MVYINISSTGQAEYEYMNTVVFLVLVARMIILIACCCFCYSVQRVAMLREEQGRSSRTILSSSIVVDMDLKVTDFYPFNADLSGKFLTCLDQQSLSGKFVFNLLLLKYLTEKRPVHIVSFNSSRNHFDSILRKHSFDCTKLEQAGLLKFYFSDSNCASLTESLQYDENLAERDVPYATVSLSHDSSIEQERLLCVVDILKSLISTLSTPIAKSLLPVVLVDDLNAFETLFLHRSYMRGSDHIEFGQSYISALHTLLSVNKIHSLVCYGEDCSDDNTFKPYSLMEYCKARADDTVVVACLDSGFSSEVHGQLVMSSQHGLTSQRLLFKAMDTGIKCCVSRI